MIAFGTCVGPSGRYEESSLPSIEAVREADGRVLAVRGATSICSAYNELIRQARALPDLEALVLLHDDVVIQDRNFLPRIRRVLRQPDVGVIGVVGHRNVPDLRYWKGTPGFGRVWNSTWYSHHGEPRGEAHAVDGLIMVLSRRAVETMEFDEATFPGFLGYDADYCMSCRKAGLRVMVEPFLLYHYSSGSALSPAFADANARFVAKWSGELSRLPLSERSTLVRSWSRRGRSARRAFRPVALESAELLRRVEGRAASKLRHVARRWGRTGQRSPAAVQTRPVDAPLPPELCVACNGPLDPVEQLPLLRCRTCGTFATSPPPAVDETSDDIFTEFYGGRRMTRRAQWQSEARSRVNWIQTWAPEGILLEVGSASGELIAAATATGYEAYGIEPSRGIRAQTPELAHVTFGSLDEWKREFAGFTVDAVALFHVLEHIPQPEPFLREVGRAMADGALLFVEVPNAGSRSATAQDAGWRWGFNFHYWHYTPTGLRRLFEESGFTVLDLHEFTFRPYLTNKQWENDRALERRDGFLEPSRDLMRAVVRRNG